MFVGEVLLIDLLLMFLYLEVFVMDLCYLWFGWLLVWFLLFIVMMLFVCDLILCGVIDSFECMLMMIFGIVLFVVGVLILSFG